MHITEGIITGVPAMTTAAVGAGVVGLGIAKMMRFSADHPHRGPLLGMAGAFIFFLSLIPIPAFTGTCSHPCGSPLAGILLGPWIGIALSGFSLLLQAAFFAHGGFSTWGVNVLALGVGGALFGWLAFRLARLLRAPIWLAGALGGLIGDVMTYVISGAALVFFAQSQAHAQQSLLTSLLFIYGAYLPTQGPIALGEMVLTGLTLHYIYQQRPEVLESLRVIAPKRLPQVIGLLLVLCGAGLCVQPVRAQAPTAIVMQAPAFLGMDEAVNERYATKAGRPAREPYLNPEKLGDLWNTLLLLAGGICGFVIGRWWHLLFKRSTSKEVCDEQS